MSVQRECSFYKASNGKYYLFLEDPCGSMGAEWLTQCDVFGPFSSLEKAEEELENHSNPGGYDVIDERVVPSMEALVSKAMRPNRR